MKSLKYFFIPATIFLSFSLKAQMTVSYHLNPIAPFIGVNYEFKNGIITEFRFQTMLEFESINYEGLISYGFYRRDDITAYAGFGATSYYDLTGLWTPIGLNIYPFEKKNTGFQIEMGPSLWEGETLYLRSSVGIRYRFGKN